MADLGELGDGDLAGLALGGRQAAYRVLLDRHRALVFRIARHHCGEEEAALDITQQAFISAFAALGRYDRARPFAHWIARIAINKCRDRARRRRLRAALRLARPIEEAIGLGDAAPLPDRQVADAEELRRTMAAIARLPARLKEVLVLRAIEGLSQAETAAVLGISEKAVETRLYRARKNLVAQLRDGVG
ncbi:MAG TPA: sigma-70 family RNA polymerase sigma factor [Novosphingobium sp.]|nr:sigma-70 family RNA polymerase sigma factor [Novosphingobium sp.]HZV11447.1 sigma-70 family RNA polymerase sigma factor [Novosphingobium sp.]